jgi:hypothetical protein
MVVLGLLKVIDIFSGLLESLHGFGFLDSLLLAAKIFMASPVLILVLSATINHLLTTATIVFSFL